MGPSLILAAVISVCVCALSLAGYYGLSAPWWRTWSGRAIFSLSTIIFVWFLLGTIVHFAPWSPLADLIASLCIAVLIDAAFITLLVSLIRARAGDRQGRQSESALDRLGRQLKGKRR